jgi:hypothetical protein
MKFDKKAKTLKIESNPSLDNGIRRLFGKKHLGAKVVNLGG